MIFTCEWITCSVKHGITLSTPLLGPTFGDICTFIITSSIFWWGCPCPWWIGWFLGDMAYVTYSSYVFTSLCALLVHMWHLRGYFAYMLRQIVGSKRVWPFFPWRWLSVVDMLDVETLYHGYTCLIWGWIYYWKGLLDLCILCHAIDEDIPH